jgi:hypothetical protein
VIAYSQQLLPALIRIKFVLTSVLIRIKSVTTPLINGLQTDLMER